MSNSAERHARWPVLDGLLARETLARLPTPVREYQVGLPAGKATVFVKLDNLTAEVYGGNKVRKLEYLLGRARQKNCERVATFGTVGSHHALATALYSHRLGYPCTCFLSHQRITQSAAETLNLHLRIGTRLVRYGGNYETRLQTLRENLWGQHAWVVPAGGSSWLGTFAFVMAAIELAGQLTAERLPEPQRLYVATGTMGTAAGLALGLALCGLQTEVHAVRVSHTWLCNEQNLERLIRKTARMMRRLDRSIPEDLGRRVNIRLRHEFFAGGYAKTDAGTDAAIAFANEQLHLTLEATYTGKAMAALIDDLGQRSSRGAAYLFWNTFNSAELPVSSAAPLDRQGLPEEFLRYFPRA